MATELKNVLWVDDEIDQLGSHIIFLEQKGYKITKATNGEDAVLLVGKNNFDLVLLDEMMPGKDGLTTLEEIKKISPNLPVIMVTKSEEERLMEQAIGEKISFYITKPVNPSQILSVAKKILEEKSIREKHVVKQYIEQFNQLKGKLNFALTAKDWIDIHHQLCLWDLELENFREPSLTETHQGLKKECNLEFGKFIEREYPLWLKSPAGGGSSSAGKERPLLSVDVVPKFLQPILLENKPTFFIILDCMRLDQWLAVEGVLNEYFNIKKEFYYSILPTATPYSRNAIFSGLFPDELAQKFPEVWKSDDENEHSRNRYERQLLDAQLKRLGVALKSEAKYAKILDITEGESIAKKISSFMNVPLFSLVFNFLDILSHGRSESEILIEIAPDEAAFRSLMKSWFNHSALLDILKYLSTQDCNVVFTTDHGSVLGTRANLAYGKRDTSPHLRYKYGDNLNTDPKGAILIKNPKDYRLPFLGIATTYLLAKEDYYFVYPTKFHEYEKEFKNTFQHGGISMEEMILPVTILKPKRK